MNTDQFKRARSKLGVKPAEFAAMLGLGRHGKRTVQRIEAGANITGPMALAVQHLLDKHSATPKDQENSSE